MSWQLANEPRPGSDANASPHFDVFVEVDRRDRGLHQDAGAAKQLVSTGNEGWMGTARQPRAVREGRTPRRTSTT